MTTAKLAKTARRNTRRLGGLHTMSSSIRRMKGQDSVVLYEDYADFVAGIPFTGDDGKSFGWREVQEEMRYLDETRFETDEASVTVARDTIAMLRVSLKAALKLEHSIR